MSAIVTHPPRVLILTTTFLPVVGGTQYFLKWFLDGMDRTLGEDAVVEMHFAYPNVAADEHADFHHIHTHNLALRGRGKFELARLIARLGLLLRKIKPQIVHCNSVSPDGLCVLLASRIFSVPIDLVVTSHGQDIVSIPEMEYGSLLTPRGRLIARQVTRQLAAHVVPSHDMVNHAVAAGSRRDRVEVIHNGVPMSGERDFEADDREAAGLQLPPLAGDGIYVLSLSSGRHVKNLVGLVQAMALAAADMGSSKLVLGCTGPLADPIVRLVKDKGLAGRVVFCGELTGARKRAYFEACHVYCLPSHFEAFGLVALEAMKFGAALVATRRGGPADFVEHETSGLLVEPSHPPDIASALVRLYRDPSLRARLIASAHETVAGYSISRVVGRYLALYCRLAEGRSSGDQGVGPSQKRYRGSRLRVERMLEE